MRNFLLVILVGASACGARTATTTLPTHYACGDAEVVHEGGALLSGQATKATRLGWHDADGDHFVSWPLSTTDIEATETVIPDDPRQDAVKVVYDTREGRSTADWRLVKREVCTAKGGYNDVLARYMKGATLDEIASELALSDRDEARAVVHKAIVTLQKKYWRDQ